MPWFRRQNQEFLCHSHPVSSLQHQLMIFDTIEVQVIHKLSQLIVFMAQCVHLHNKQHNQTLRQCIHPTRFKRIQ